MNDPILASTAGYVTDLLDSFAPEREASPRLYRLVNASLDALVAVAEPAPVARYFEAWLLRLTGSYPRARRCPACGRALSEEGARYLPSEHRLECRRCLSAGVSLSPESLVYLERIWSTAPADLPAPSERAVLPELSAFHYRLIQEQLERDLRSHQVLEDLLKERRPS